MSQGCGVEVGDLEFLLSSAAASKNAFQGLACYFSPTVAWALSGAGEACTEPLYSLEVGSSGLTLYTGSLPLCR